MTEKQSSRPVDGGLDYCLNLLRRLDEAGERGRGITAEVDLAECLVCSPEESLDDGLLHLRAWEPQAALENLPQQRP